MFCEKCGYRLTNADKRCPACGTERTSAQNSSSPNKIYMFYASSWQRFLAYIIDTAIGYAAAFCFGLICGLFGRVEAAAASAYLFVILFYLLYFVIMETSIQATVGKIAVGIYVGDINGNKLPFLKTVIRVILRFFLGWALVFGDPGTNDTIVGFRVLKGKPGIKDNQ